MTSRIDQFEALAAEVGDVLLTNGESLVTAESCTGGLVSACLTSIEGSSRWFERGFVVYANAAKIEMLGVPDSVLAAEGAVSEAVAAHLARGALRQSAADWAISITGIAGPGGGTTEKPVGTVCFGWASRAGLLEVETAHFAGSRKDVRAQSLVFVLNGLLVRAASKMA